MNTCWRWSFTRTIAISYINYCNSIILVGIQEVGGNVLSMLSEKVRLFARNCLKCQFKCQFIIIFLKNCEPILPILLKSILCFSSVGSILLFTTTLLVHNLGLLFFLPVLIRWFQFFFCRKVCLFSSILHLAKFSYCSFYYNKQPKISTNQLGEYNLLLKIELLALHTS